MSPARLIMRGRKSCQHRLRSSASFTRRACSEDPTRYLTLKKNPRLPAIDSFHEFQINLKELAQSHLPTSTAICHHGPCRAPLV